MKEGPQRSGASPWILAPLIQGLKNQRTDQVADVGQVLVGENGFSI